MQTKQSSPKLKKLSMGGIWIFSGTTLQTKPKQLNLERSLKGNLHVHKSNKYAPMGLLGYSKRKLSQKNANR